jgi:transposase-like protein
MTGLPDKIFEMYQVGMTPKQIADALDLDPSEVNRTIWRVRKRREKKALEVVG